MKLIFVGVEHDPTEAAECEVNGVVFPRGKAITVSGDLFELLAPNPAFKAVPGKPVRTSTAETEQE